MNVWSEAAKEKSAGVVTKLNATKLLCDLKSAGYAVSAEGESLSVKGPPLNDQLRARLKQLKEGILAVLGVVAQVSAEPWDDTKAASLIEEAQHRRDTVGRSDDAERFIKQRVAADAIDAAWVSKDLALLRVAVADFLKLFPLEGEPLFTDEDGHAWHRGPTNDCIVRDDFVGWYRERAPNKGPWEQVSAGSTREKANDGLHDFTTKKGPVVCDTIILPKGEHPGRKSK